MMRQIDWLPYPVAALFCFLSTAQSHAQEYIVDQSNLVFPDGDWNIVFYSPIGQEFRPTLPWLDVVEFWTRDLDGVPQSTELQVRIHENTITGPTLGQSRIVHVAPDQGGPVLFAFDTSVPLIPEERYVMELVDVGDWYWMISGEIENHYLRGRGILSGNPSESIDFWFREGMNAVTGVDSNSWGRIKTIFR